MKDGIGLAVKLLAFKKKHRTWLMLCNCGRWLDTDEILWNHAHSIFVELCEILRAHEFDIEKLVTLTAQNPKNGAMQYLPETNGFAFVGQGCGSYEFLLDDVFRMVADELKVRDQLEKHGPSVFLRRNGIIPLEHDYSLNYLLD